MNPYVPVIVMMILAGILAVAMVTISMLFGPRRPSDTKGSPYECGITPVGDARERFSVRFYLVAILFVMFDVEAAFLYPWAVVFGKLKLFGFIEMAIFIAIVFVGYVYAWKKGALDWRT